MMTEFAARTFLEQIDNSKQQRLDSKMVASDYQIGGCLQILDLDWVS